MGNHRFNFSFSIISILFTWPTFSIASETSRTNRQSTPTINTTGPSARDSHSDKCPAAMMEWVNDDFNNNIFGIGGPLKFSQTESLQQACLQTMKDDQRNIASKAQGPSIVSATDYTKALSEKI